MSPGTNDDEAGARQPATEQDGTAPVTAATDTGADPRGRGTETAAPGTEAASNSRAETDAGSATESDAGGRPDAGSGSATESDAGGRPDAGSGSVGESNAGGRADAGSGSATESDAGGRPDAGSGSATESDAGGRADAGSGTATEADSRSGSGSATESNAGGRADAGSGSVGESNAGGRADTGSGSVGESDAGADAGSGTATEADSRSGSGSGSSSGSTPGPGTDAGSDQCVPHDSQQPPASGAGERVAALRRFSVAGRRWRAARRVGCAVLLAVAVTGGAVAVGAGRDRAPVSVAAADAVDPGLLGSGSLDASIAALQAHLRSQPRDFDGWATLGLAYDEQARTKGDPSRYPQADKALQRSLSLAPDNDQALAGRAALAAARHDFRHALTYADRALEQNPYSERALCSRIDALVELGRYDEASRAAETADARKPGVPVFTRYAYVHELRGDVTTARRVLTQALAAATSPGDTAYVASQLGQLSWNQGDYPTALTYYARALAADDSYLPALEGRARAQAAGGRRAEAIEGMETVVARYPLPGPLVELGELYEARGAAGDRARAERQYALVDAWIALARANGVNADLDTALAAADHGDKASALRAARAEWARRHTVHTADALAWALHVNGEDAAALPYARRATATGYRNAAFRYHLGMIELATGHAQDGRASLRAALRLNPGFSPLGAATARKALEGAR
ncbi:tetratricopeptide repeat protein [Streptomyces sp. NPDC052301]|uniref:tetratricopeptide repeat protein n=1 Tax=Streptomyces sp. NPDC052301 TaxID=3365687 RepID=UPI0037CF8DF0